jgi:hypothetical protein
MPQNDDKDPKTGADDAKVDRILSGMKGARMPDILKVQSSESRGEKFAAYQGSHALKPGEDTQNLEPAVLVDQTQQEGILASEVEQIRNERRERGRRDATTAVIEAERIPKKKNTIPLMVFLGMLALAAVGLIVKANQESADEDGIAPATAAVITDTAAPNIPPPPTAVAPSTTPTITSAAISPESTNQPNSAQISASSTSSAASHSSSPSSSSEPGNNDPDRLLFKPHRTP